MNDIVRDWVDQSAYCQALGLTLDSLDDSRAGLVLPFREANANPGNALHGGVAVSASVSAAQAVARQVLGAESGPWHCMDLQINYLAAAIGEDIRAEATLRRRGKELCFVAVEVSGAEGKPIAQSVVAVRGRQGRPAVERPLAGGDDGEHEPGFIADRLAANPFISGRGIAIELMREGRVRLVMPWQESNASRDGGVHEGALLALLDTAGAMCSWSVTGPGRFKASTPSIQAQILAPCDAVDLVAYGRVACRDNEMFWNDVEVAEKASGRLIARGTVLYRIFD